MKHLMTLVFCALAAVCFSQNYGNVNINFGPGGPGGAGIDTSFISNDSVFVVAGVDTIFTGLGANTSNDGRILYVTKQGNDATAVIGNYFKPFLTIQGAITAATAGDLIVVYPGIYTESNNLGQKNAIQYRFFKNSICQGCFINTTVTNASISVYGQGSFVGYAGRFFRQGSGYIYIEADSVSGGNVFEFVAGSRMNFDAVLQKVNTTGSLTWGIVKDTSIVDNFSIDIDRLEAVNFMYGSSPNTIYNISVKTVILKGLDFISFYQNNLNKSRAYIRVDNLIDNYVGAEHLFYQLQDAASRKMNDMQIIVDVGTYVGDGELLNYTQTSPSAPNSYIEFNCNSCVYTGSGSFFFTGGIANSMNDTKYTINVKGNYSLTNASGSFINVTANTPTTFNPRINFTGNYNATNSTVSPFQFKTIGPNIYFQNAKIITSSSAIAPITATGASNVYIMNTFTNSTTTNANVTENIQPFFRNTNVK